MINAMAPRICHQSASSAEGPVETVPGVEGAGEGAGDGRARSKRRVIIEVQASDRMAGSIPDAILLMAAWGHEGLSVSPLPASWIRLLASG